MLEQELHKGCIPDKIDERDYKYEDVLGAGVLVSDEEWKQGYNVETVLNFKLPIKNQFQSESCVGQGWSYYKAVLDKVETKIYNEDSAKSIYSQINLGYLQGAQIRDGATLLTTWGVAPENLVKSYRDNGTTDENWMIDKTWKTPIIDNAAKILQAKEYRLISGFGIDVFARAIKDNYGVVGGVVGTNNGTWLSLEPQPPLDTTPQSQTWGHCLYFCGFGIDEKGKYLLTPNSWGDLGGLQKIRENYFTNNNRWIFNPWTLVDKSNNNDMIFQKEVGKPAIYLIDLVKMTKTLIVDMPTFNAFDGQFAEVSRIYYTYN